MSKLLPFVNKPAEEIEIVGNENTGLLYLVKRHGVTPNENPSDFQEQQKKQQKFLLKLTQRIKELAREEGVPIHEMRKRVMGATAPEKPADEEGSTTVEIVDSDEQQMFDYLDEQTAELLFNLQEDKANLAIRAATYMLQYRVVYPIIPLNNVVAGSKQLLIESPQAPIEAHTSIKFGPTRFAEVTDTLIPAYGSGETLSVDELPFQLREGEVGFLCEPGTRKLQVGYPDWTEQDTRDSLSEEIIALLFNFYQKEAGIVADIDETGDETDTSEDEGNLLNPSSEPLPMSPSTGETSITGSNGSGSETNDSATKTLATSQLG